MNPRAATNDLLPFQGSPFGQLGYFSKSGEGGIRTHAPFRTNGFQDRLVMTTSIPLHVSLCSELNCNAAFCDGVYSIILTKGLSIDFLYFMPRFLTVCLKKPFPDFQITWCCDFYILI